MFLFVSFSSIAFSLISSAFHLLSTLRCEGQLSLPSDTRHKNSAHEGWEGKVGEEITSRVNKPGVQRVAVDTKTKATGCQQEETFLSSPQVLRS